MPGLETNVVISGCNQRKLKKALCLDKVIKSLFPFRPPRAIPSSFDNIVVIQSHLIGDLVMVTPLLKALRNKYPNAEISLMANASADDLLKGAWFVDEIITADFPWATNNYSLNNIISVLRTLLQVRQRNIDLAIDAQIDMRNVLVMFLMGAKRRLGYALTGGGRFLTDIPEFPENVSSLLDARLSVLSYLGIECVDRSATLPLSHNDFDYVDSWLSKNGLDNKKLIAIHPGASKKEKLWLATNFANVVRYVESKGFRVVLIEGPSDEKILQEIQKEMNQPLPCFKGSLRSVVAFISRCRLLICVDSAAIHLAGAVGTPVLALYGPQWPSLTKPIASNIEVLCNEELDCRPCDYGRCKHATNVCMTSITPEQVISKISQIIQTMKF